MAFGSWGGLSGKTTLRRGRSLPMCGSPCDGRCVVTVDQSPTSTVADDSQARRLGRDFDPNEVQWLGLIWGAYQCSPSQDLRVRM